MGFFDNLKNAVDGLGAIMDETNAEEKMNKTLYELSIIKLNGDLKNKVETALTAYGVQYLIRMRNTYEKGQAHDALDARADKKLAHYEELALDALQTAASASDVPEALRTQCQEVRDWNVNANAKTAAAQDKFINEARG